MDILIRERLRPEQVSGRKAVENTLKISHETIYTPIYDEKRAEGDLWQHLRCQEGWGILKNHANIYDRPNIVDLRERIGNWEGDTVIGRDYKGAMGHVLRQSIAIYAGTMHYAARQAR